MMVFYFLVVALLQLCHSNKFTLTLQRGEQTCFYEQLQHQQKYAFESVLIAGISHIQSQKPSEAYQVSISRQQSGSWHQTVHRKPKNPLKKLKLHKLASATGLYVFCVHSLDSQSIKVRIEFMTGARLSDFHLMPNATDNQNIQKQIKYLNKQSDIVIDATLKASNIRSVSEQLANVVGLKMIWFGILGLISIVFISYMFYKEVKKTFKDRKMI